MTQRLAGVDVGGTFTDIAVWDAEREAIAVTKVLTTPEDPTRAIIDGLRSLERRADLVIHGTTLVTNALIERRGARIGLITTQGFRDILEIGNELRYDPFDLYLMRPEPLVPRRLRRTVEERIGADGEVIIPLDEGGVRRAGRALVDSGVEAVAVAFFGAYRNPAHERKAVELLRREFPGLLVCAAVDIAPEIREYERVSTAAANAYVLPMTSRYLAHLNRSLNTPLFVMLSDGGITSVRAASEAPIAIVESGPAAGAMIAAHLAREAGWPQIVSFDMGGTTAKICLIHGGVPQRTYNLEVARVHRFKKGSGFPLRLPTVHLMEIGAGGGSIAWRDHLGLLKVGPGSAGAVPGPACYGLGGRDPTVTDADLYLGYLDPRRFLGGRMSLHPDSAEAALASLGKTLGLDATAAAAGIHDIVNNNMAAAARMHIVEQGRDPRGYRLLALGGAGPVHSYGLARLLQLREVIFPPKVGVASAIGMLVAPRSVEHARSLVCRLDALDWGEVSAAARELEDQARGLLREAGARDDEISLQVSAEMRYAGQGYEVTVSVDPRVVARGDTAGLHAAFEAEYRQRFDRNLGSIPVEVISWRVRALAPGALSALAFEQEPQSAGSALLGERPAYFHESRGFVPAQVYARGRLRQNTVVRGPALIEEEESTVVVGPAAELHVKRDGSLTMILESRTPITEAGGVASW